MEILERLLDKYGLGVAVTAFMGVVFWNVLNWMKRQVEATIAAAEKREEESRKLWDAHRAALEAHTECSKLFHSDVAKAHDFQQREHGEQIKALEKINERLESLTTLRVTLRTDFKASFTLYFKEGFGGRFPSLMGGGFIMGTFYK
jgi:hypothetical protein